MHNNEYTHPLGQLTRTIRYIGAVPLLLALTTLFGAIELFAVLNDSAPANACCQLRRMVNLLKTRLGLVVDTGWCSSEYGKLILHVIFYLTNVIGTTHSMVEGYI